MLSDRDITLAIQSGDIMIEPFNKESFRPGGYTFHLSDFILVARAGKIVDVKNKIAPDYDNFEITMDKPFQLDPGKFVLSATYEKISVSSSICFMIEGRSTLARLGLTIVQSAMMVDPGHQDRAITLELANHGPNSILLYPKMKIGRGIFFRLDTPASFSYDEKGGKYRVQERGGKPIFTDEFGPL